jgi:hypothetical protein
MIPDYNSYIIHLRTSEYLNRELTGEFLRFHRLLTDLWDGVEIVVHNRLPDRIHFIKDEECLIIYEPSKSYMGVDYLRIWSEFTDGYGMPLAEVESLLSVVMEQHLGCGRMGSIKPVVT